jgi:prephenate dehydrogenase
MGEISSIAIVGPGLIGTSVALAATRRWPDLQVRSVNKGEPLSAIGDASVVLLSAPVDAILEAIPRLPAFIHSNTLVMDTGSTKHAIVSAARKANIRQFVGGHPMAGGTSVADARADLFDGRPWFLSNPDAPDALHRATKFVQALGARPIVLDDHGEEHDRLMAAISHLPQVTSSMLMAIVGRVVEPVNLRFAGDGLRDTTRLAASEAAVWQSILASNSKELRPLLKFLAAALEDFADHLDDAEAVRTLFDEANRVKSSL